MDAQMKLKISIAHKQRDYIHWQRVAQTLQDAAEHVLHVATVRNLKTTAAVQLRVTSEG